MPEPPRFTPGESVRLLIRGPRRQAPVTGRVAAFDGRSVVVERFGSSKRVRIADIREVERVDG